MLPRAVLDELVNVVLQAINRVVPCPATAPTTSRPSGSTRITATSAPSPTATASSTADGRTTESAIPGIDWPALARDVNASEGPDPSTSRYPASNASSRKGTRRR